MSQLSPHSWIHSNAMSLARLYFRPEDFDVADATLSPDERLARQTPIEYLKERLAQRDSNFADILARWNVPMTYFEVVAAGYQLNGNAYQNIIRRILVEQKENIRFEDAQAWMQEARDEQKQALQEWVAQKALSQQQAEHVQKINEQIAQNEAEASRQLIADQARFEQQQQESSSNIIAPATAVLLAAVTASEARALQTAQHVGVLAALDASDKYASAGLTLSDEALAHITTGVAKAALESNQRLQEKLDYYQDEDHLKTKILDDRIIALPENVMEQLQASGADTLREKLEGIEDKAALKAFLRGLSGDEVKQLLDDINKDLLAEMPENDFAPSSREAAEAARQERLSMAASRAINPEYDQSCAKQGAMAEVVCRGELRQARERCEKEAARQDAIRNRWKDASDKVQWMSDVVEGFEPESAKKDIKENFEAWLVHCDQEKCEAILLKLGAETATNEIAEKEAFIGEHYNPAAMVDAERQERKRQALQKTEDALKAWQQQVNNIDAVLKEPNLTPEACYKAYADMVALSNQHLLKHEQSKPQSQEDFFKQNFPEADLSDPQFMQNIALFLRFQLREVQQAHMPEGSRTTDLDFHKGQSRKAIFEALGLSQTSELGQELNRLIEQYAKGLLSHAELAKDLDTLAPKLSKQKYQLVMNHFDRMKDIEADKMLDFKRDEWAQTYAAMRGEAPGKQDLEFLRDAIETHIRYQERALERSQEVAQGQPAVGTALTTRMRPTPSAISATEMLQKQLHADRQEVAKLFEAMPAELKAEVAAAVAQCPAPCPANPGLADVADTLRAQMLSQVSAEMLAKRRVSPGA